MPATRGAGKYRHRIKIEKVTETRSSSGALSESWATHATRWAEMEALAGNERFLAEREHGEVSHMFELRHHLGTVTPKMRISYSSRTFDIQAAYDPDGTKRKLVILTREEV